MRAGSGRRPASGPTSPTRRPGWQAHSLHRVGLDDLPRRAALPPVASAIATPLGPLTAAAAADLGLTTACAVGCGLIDAHAGALGLLGRTLEGGEVRKTIAMIAGTSTCHMALALEPRAVPGVWGPYYGAVAPGLWLNEGGQSATGALLDHILAWHAEGRALGARRARPRPRSASPSSAHRKARASPRGLHVLPGLPRQPLAARRPARHGA